MVSWIEVIIYTLIQLASINLLNFILIISCLAYLSYRLFRWLRPYLKKSWSKVKQVWKDRAELKQSLNKKVKTWKNEGLDWKKAFQHSGKSLKRLIEVVPAFLLLVFGNLFVRILYKLPFFKQERKRFNKEGKPILHFKSYRSFVFMGIGFSFLAFILTNYLVTVLRAAIRYLYFTVLSFFGNGQGVSFNFDSLLLKNLLNSRVFFLAPILAVPIFIIGLIISWRSAWINFEQYRDYNHNEEGDDRFATVKEIRQQYKKVPNKTETYPGEGGALVLHETRKNLVGLTLGTQMMWQNKLFSRYVTKSQRVLGLQSVVSGDYYIDDNTTNLLGYGITRSGKGEGHITTTIDINSRAEIQPSMVIGDPKGEHYQASYKTMRKRGYDVDVLSFQNMDWSMSFNPLALAIAAAKKGYYEKTQTLVNAVSESLYPKQPGGEKGNSEYFRKSSVSLFNALTMALIDRAAEAFRNGESDAWDTITVPNVAQFLASLGSEEVLVDEFGNIVENPDPDQHLKKKSKITVYFDNLRKINSQTFSKFRQMADIEFRASDFGGEETKGNIYSSMMTGINLFLQDNIAKLTSKNSIDLESFGSPRRLSVKFRSSTALQLKNEFAYQTAKVSISSPDGQFYVKEQAALIDAEGYLNYIIAPKLPDQFLVTIDFNHESNGHSPVRQKKFQFSAEKVYRKLGKVIKLDEYTKKPIIEGIKITVHKGEGEHLLQETDIKMVYSDNPKIVYLVTPPNRTEYNGIVSLFLDQLFNANYELALASPGRKCVNRILHILDEFTNLPIIPNMETKISIGLGQNILYHLWIQNLEQLVNVYGKNVSVTIQENCSIKVYVKTTSGKTNAAFSKDLGTRTITKRRRSSNILDEANPNVSVDQSRQELLSPTQLAKLQEGEAVIQRGVKGRDLSGRKITTDPIFLHEKTSLPYRYMFLQEEFDHSMTLADIPVQSEHRGLNLQDIAVDAQVALSNIIDWRMRLTSRLGSPGGEEPKLATRYQKAKSLGQQQFTSPADMITAAAEEVIYDGYDDIEVDDLFFEDDVI